MIEFIKRTIKNNLQKQGYAISRKPAFLLTNANAVLDFDLEVFIRAALYDQQELYLLQIGAYDGTSNDPIYSLIQQYPINTILVEPNTIAFERLSTAYTDNPKVRLENIAVAEKDGIEKFFVLKGESCPLQFEQLSSFSKDTILSHKRWYPNLENWLHEEMVECKTVETLLREHQFERLDLLVLDVEGYEENILRSINFYLISPQIIYYESCHLAPIMQDRLLRSLFLMGYKFAIQGANTLAYRV